MEKSNSVSFIIVIVISQYLVKENVEVFVFASFLHSTKAASLPEREIFRLLILLF